MEKLSRRLFAIEVARIALVAPPAAALAFVGHQVEESNATSFAGATFGAAFGAAFGGIQTVEDASEQPVTRIFFLNLVKGILGGAVGGFVSINFKRIKAYLG